MTVDSILVGPPQKDPNGIVKALLKGKRRQLANEGGGAMDPGLFNAPSDWDAVSGPTQVLNKPTLGTASPLDVPATGNATATQVVLGSDTRLTALTSLPVYANNAAALATLVAGQFYRTGADPDVVCVVH